MSALATTTGTAAPVRLIDSLRRILPLAWPVVVGQLALLAYGTLDTILVGRHATADLAALAVGGAAYITVFVGLMGTVLAISPIVGRLFGAGQPAEAGRQFWQAMWLAAGLGMLGCAVLMLPAPFLALAQATPEVEAKVRGYLLVLACTLPAGLLFTVYRGFNTAVSRPKAVMVLQLGALGIKVPLSLALVGGVPALGIPALGVIGCALGTMVAMWSQAGAAAWMLRRDPFYRPFALGQVSRRPDAAALRALLKLGVPMGLGIGVEVTGFVFMALFISRLGEVPVAGHQIAANLVSLLFMLPLGLSNGCSTLVAQRIGAGDLRDARQLGWHGLQFALLLALALGGVVYLLRGAVVGLYTHSPAVAAATLPLLAWVALFHAADAVQTMGAFVLRAWQMATAPMVVYVLALWGVGLGGGYLLAFDTSGTVPAAMNGAPGFWLASTGGLTLAALMLAGLLHWLTGRRVAEQAGGRGLSAR